MLPTRTGKHSTPRSRRGGPADFKAAAEAFLRWATKPAGGLWTNLATARVGQILENASEFLDGLAYDATEGEGRADEQRELAIRIRATPTRTPPPAPSISGTSGRSPGDRLAEPSRTRQAPVPRQVGSASRQPPAR